MNRSTIMHRKINKDNGQAILMVLSMLGIVSVVGLSFLYMSQVQLRGISSYLGRLQTKYLAEAGINYAKKILEFDAQTQKIDSEDDLWYTTFSGNEADVDLDGTLESKWFYIKDEQGNDIGRYAVLVRDEAAKVNINGDKTIMEKFFSGVGLSGQGIVDEILKYRYGNDQKPGLANTDDNSNNSGLEEDSLDNDADGS